MTGRLANAIERVRGCIAVAADMRSATIGNDDDLVDELGLDELELESLQLMLEEIFAISVPDELWAGSVYRTAASLAEWCIRQSDQAAWEASRQERKRA